jgi:aspartate racemase
MKIIGLLGGMSWESSLEYYRIINQEAGRRLGGLHSAECVMYSVDFAPVEELLRAGRWDAIASLLAAGARRLEAAGAAVVLIATNTMHHVADRVREAVTAPLLHIGDATGRELARRGFRRVALLGTRFTMEMDFYRTRLEKAHGLKVLVPDAPEREVVHQIIYDELGRGIIREESRRAYVKIIEGLVGRGAQGVVLGCTEIPLLIKEKDSPVPVFDTTALHAQAAVDFALGG